MHTDRSLTRQDINPFDLATGGCRTGHFHRRARRQTSLSEVLVVVALVTIEMAAALAVALILAPIAWPFS